MTKKVDEQQAQAEIDSVMKEVDQKYTVLDLKVVKEKVPTYSSEKLCEMIVCDRYFGCYKEMAIICMEELSRRRVAGNDFDFESYIEKSFNELPKLDFKVIDLGDILRGIINRKMTP